MAARQVEFLMAGSRKADGTVNAAGYCYFLNTGADTYQAVYDTKALNAYTTTAGTGTDPIANVEYVLLDSGGKPTQGDVFADGTYNIKIYESDGTLVDTIDDATYEVPASASDRSAADKTTNFSVADDANLKDVYFVSTTGGNVAATMDVAFTVAAADAGFRIQFVRETAGGNTFTINPAAGDTINGSATYTLDSQYEFCILESKSSGTDWYVTSGVSSADVPTIDDFTNAGHDHTSTAQGSTIAGVPAATIFAYAATGAAPSGYVLCDGASYLRTSPYDDLFAAIGSLYGSVDGTHFNVPDLQGEFIRGWDNGKGSDPDSGDRTDAGDGITSGDNIGTKQSAATRTHTHLAHGTSANAQGSGGNISHTNGSNNTATAAPVGGVISATDSYPRNVCFQHIIKL